MYVRPYTSEAEYLAHQKEKTEHPILQAKIKARWGKDLGRFAEGFTCLKGVLPPDAQAVCLGARLGAEVQALRNLGYIAIGIDLVPCPPLVIKGDFSAIPLCNGTKHLAYCNSIDHVLHMERFVAEIGRVLKRPGWFLGVVPIGTFGNYEARRIDSTMEILEFFPGFEVVHARQYPSGNHQKHEFLLRRD